jgi:sporulation protein YlmC with PRC-barrel domain
MRSNARMTQWKIGATAAAAALGLSGLAMAQQDKPADAPESRVETAKTLQVSVNNDDFAMARRWQKADDLMGKKVVNAANEDLGKLENIVVDANSGRVLYGVLSFGGTMGMGDKLFAIPWRSLSLGDDAKAFTLNVEKESLKNAPGFDKKQWPNFADEKWATTTYEYYKQAPYWRSDAKPATDMSRVSYRDRWYHQPLVWQKASDLTGKDIHNTKNEDLGRISDLIIDPDHGRVTYGVLSHRSRLFAIPWNALSLSSDAKKFVLNVDKQRLTDAISFTKDNWPNFTDNGWAIETHRVYVVQPYWTDVPIERPVVAP